MPSGNFIGRLATLILAGWLCAAGALADEPAPASAAATPEPVVDRIEYAGNFRLQTSVIDKICGIRPGMRQSEVDFGRIVRRLEATRLFSRVEPAWKSEAGATVLVLQLEERITFIVLPQITYSSGVWTLGAYLLESDLLGTGAAIGAGGSWSVEKWSALLGTMAPHIDGQDIGYSLFATATGGVGKWKNPNNTAILAWEGEQIAVNGSLNLFTDSSFSPTIGLGWTWLNLRKTDGMAGFGEGTRSYLQPSASIGYKAMKPHGWYSEGFSTRLGYGLDISLAGGEVRQELGFRLSFSQGVADKAVLGATVLAEYGDRPLVLAKGKSGSGFRTLPGNVMTNQSAAAALGCELLLADLQWARVTAACFAEAGVLRLQDRQLAAWRWFGGPGVGLRLYLPNVVIPAIGLDLGFNLPANYASLGFSVGMGF